VWNLVHARAGHSAGGRSPEWLRRRFPERETPVDEGDSRPARIGLGATGQRRAIDGDQIVLAGDARRIPRAPAADQHSHAQCRHPKSHCTVPRCFRAVAPSFLNGDTPRAGRASPGAARSLPSLPLGNVCTTRCVALGVGARGAYTRGHSETRHVDVCPPEPAPRLRILPSLAPSRVKRPPPRPPAPRSLVQTFLRAVPPGAVFPVGRSAPRAS